MAVYQININEKMSLGKSLLAYLQSIPQIATLEKQVEKSKYESEFYQGLQSAFTDVRLMLDGKKKEKTLDEFIEELEREQSNELCHSHD